MAIRTSPALRLGTPTPLFTLRGDASWTDFDVTPDGQRILAIVLKVAGDRSPATVVTNWPRGIGR
jgi:hypothetical protein